MHLFEPHPRFSWTIHIDGLRERHDAAVCRDGVFDKAVAAVKEAKRRGFQVTTNTTFFKSDIAEDVRSVLDFLNDELGVDGMMISPGFAYEKAPRPGAVLGRARRAQALSRGVRQQARRVAPQPEPALPRFPRGQGRARVHAVGDPELLDLRLAEALLPDVRRLRATYKELLETTDWEKYGRGKDQRCYNCMAHCGYEPSAVLATMGSLKESIRAATAT